MAGMYGERKKKVCEKETCVSGLDNCLDGIFTDRVTLLEEKKRGRQKLCPRNEFLRRAISVRREKNLMSSVLD